MQQWQERVSHESLDLSEKIEKLTFYLEGDNPQTVDMLETQLFHMVKYQQILLERIALFQ